VAPACRWPIWSPAFDGRSPAPVGPRAPSCLRKDWPSCCPRGAMDGRGNLPKRDVSYQAWQRALRQNAEANNAARAKDWAARTQALQQMRLSTPSKIVPWHLTDGSVSHLGLATATDDLYMRTQATVTAPAGDEQLGRSLAGWPSYAPHRMRALLMSGMDLALLH